MSVIFITGATAGFGKAIAQKFSEAKWDIIINGRRKERLAQLEEELKANGSKVLSLPFDVRNEQEVNNAIQQLPQEWKKIDVLINNAGLAAGSNLIQDGNSADWNTMIDTNVKGLLYVTQNVIPGMIAAKKGHIINMSSIAGKEAYMKGNVYCATKHAVDALTKSMRVDLLEHGIKVSSVDPGAAETEFSLVRLKGDVEKAKAVYKGFQPLVAEDIAEIVYFVATRPAHVCINDLIVTPTAQANTSHLLRKTE
ncbi:MAG: SDR family NAD(P)-dependent oxidoreductase [Bacteroidia bacterium]|nr:SDR family NAD(P)-dependent oxidoreductase [Bacteroidia bacterium]MBX3105729.1 SDR family NAD(P)-dependent oxidoreductase [Bacteroidota bacterium]MCW5932230.1 SDR family NAD(P)-dependent oxidoreductase [Bacteroidota bacterium]